MLREAGIDHVISLPPIDDAVLPERLDDPAGFTMAMALFKAAQVQPAQGDGWVLAADTMAHDGSGLIGKPRDRAHAREMLSRWRGGAHDVWTGVALLQPLTGRRWIFADRASVTLGDLADDVLEEYLDSGAWQGKAGAYNYADRLEAGWPLACEGDPCTVMGLPMRRLAPILASLVVATEPRC